MTGVQTCALPISNSHTLNCVSVFVSVSSDLSLFISPPRCLGVFLIFIMFLSLQIGDLKDHYHFFHSRTIKRSTLSSHGRHNFISMEPKVSLSPASTHTHTHTHTTGHQPAPALWMSHTTPPGLTLMMLGAEPGRRSLGVEQEGEESDWRNAQDRKSVV